MGVPVDDRVRAAPAGAPNATTGYDCVPDVEFEDRSMTYHHLDPDALDATADYPCDRRGISEAADLTLLHLARYSLEPGEQLPRSYHYHDQREEAFYVLSGTLHVETPDEEFAVEADEAFVAEPGNPHRAFNPEAATEDVVVLGTGSPRTDPALEYEPDENATE